MNRISIKRFHTHVEGTGVELYMLKRIVENNDGHIEVKSKVGEGTSFHVYFGKVNANGDS